METGGVDGLKNFLQQYRGTLETIAGRIEISNKRYDDRKIQQQIDELKQIIQTVPKVIGVKNRHHFGAWSKNLIIGVVVCFVLTAGSVGTALYLNNQNGRLNQEAYFFWMVRALYPAVSKTIETKMSKDPNGFIELAEKAMAKQQAILAAEEAATQANQELKSAKQNLKKAKAKK
ncbi:MAG: hypothetical protein ACOH2A_09695 [Sphingobacteriaceae bacterium]